MAAVLMVQGKFVSAMESYHEAIRLRPNWPDPMRDLAWILATNPKAEIRNGAEALRLAQRACELAGHPDPRYLSALEVAYAEVGRFDDALKTAQQIQQLPASPVQKCLLCDGSNQSHGTLSRRKTVSRVMLERQAIMRPAVRQARLQDAEDVSGILREAARWLEQRHGNVAG